jgi:hypothetical protein
MHEGKAGVDSFEALLDIFYLPAQYPGQQRFLCSWHEEEYTSRLVRALAQRLAQRVPSTEMGVYALGDLDWSSREALIASLAQAMEEVAPSLVARLPQMPNGNARRRVDQRLRALMDPPDDRPERVLTFVMTIPGTALREDMVTCFSQLRALISSSDHNWIIIAPPSIAQFGEGLEHMSSFHSLFETYDLRFSPTDLLDVTP